VAACGVCRTDLHVVDGELPQTRYPVTPGHQIVGWVAACGPAVRDWAPGDRVGVPWLAWACGICPYCREGRENLCRDALFTGASRDGGFAEYVTADSRFCLPLPSSYSDEQVAPLLCAGLIGYRAYRMAGAAASLGLYGYGAAAHLLAQVAAAQGVHVYAFTRPGDEKTQRFARERGATWSGDCDTLPPGALDAAIIFAPAGELVPQALRAVRPGGRVVCAGIHMSDIPAFPYSLLWEERSVHSVANLTRKDGRDFMALAQRLDLRPDVQSYPLRDASRALEDLRCGRVTGAAVLRVAPGGSPKGGGEHPG